MRLRHRTADGCIGHVMFSLKQLFQKVGGLSLGSSTQQFVGQVEDRKFSFFCEQVLAPMLRTKQGRTLIVAPSYVHYVRIRNELLKREANACFICEYSRNSEITRGRSRFYHGVHDILLYVSFKLHAAQWFISLFLYM